jgi:hypothetical protein
MKDDDFEQPGPDAEIPFGSAEQVREMRIMPSQSESVPADVYEELLGRYERALVFAGQLQEKNRQALLLEEKSGKLEHQVDNLRREVAVGEGYIRILENALKALGIFK